MSPSMKTDIKTIAATVKRSTTSMEVVAICDFVLGLPDPQTGECSECRKRKDQTSARVSKLRNKLKTMK